MRPSTNQLTPDVVLHFSIAKLCGIQNQQNKQMKHLKQEPKYFVGKRKAV